MNLQVGPAQQPTSSLAAPVFFLWLQVPYNIIKKPTNPQKGLGFRVWGLGFRVSGYDVIAGIPRLPSQDRGANFYLTESSAGIREGLFPVAPPGV